MMEFDNIEHFVNRIANFVSANGSIDNDLLRRSMAMCRDATLEWQKATNQRVTTLELHLYFLYSANRVIDLSQWFENSELVEIVLEGTQDENPIEGTDNFDVRMFTESEHLDISGFEDEGSTPSADGKDLGKTIFFDYEICVHSESQGQAKRSYLICNWNARKELDYFLKSGSTCVEQLVLAVLGSPGSLDLQRLRLAGLRVQAKELLAWMDSVGTSTLETASGQLDLVRRLTPIYRLLPEIIELARLRFGSEGEKVPRVLENMMISSLGYLDRAKAQFEAGNSTLEYSFLNLTLLARLEVVNIVWRAEVALLYDSVPLDYSDPFDGSAESWWANSGP